LKINRVLRIDQFLLFYSSYKIICDGFRLGAVLAEVYDRQLVLIKNFYNEEKKR